VEFIASMDTTYQLLARGAGSTQVVASGTCAAGWNLVPFHSSMLPLQINQGTNELFLDVQNEGSFAAGNILMVPDLKVNGITNDVDGELIRVQYKPKNKTTAQAIARGRTLYITGGSPKDRLMVTTKRPKKTKWIDHGARICGIISDSGFMAVKVEGTLDRLQCTGVVRQVMTKRGDLGQDSRTMLFDVRFDGNDKAVIKTVGAPVTRTNNLGQPVSVMISGNIRGNILVGRAFYTNDFNGVLSTNGTMPEYIVNNSQRGVNVLAAMQGNIGSSSARRWIAAKYVKRTVSTWRMRTNTGGDIVNYAYYLTGAANTKKGYSLLAMTARMIADTSSNQVNTAVVCGHDPALQRPWLVTNWVSQPVVYTIGNVKGSELLQGTFRLAKPPKKVKSKLDKAKYIIGNP